MFLQANVRREKFWLKVSKCVDRKKWAILPPSFYMFLIYCIPSCLHFSFSVSHTKNDCFRRRTTMNWAWVYVANTIRISLVEREPPSTRSGETPTPASRCHPCPVPMGATTCSALTSSKLWDVVRTWKKPRSGSWRSRANKWALQQSILHSDW